MNLLYFLLDGPSSAGKYDGPIFRACRGRPFWIISGDICDILNM
jgi:hypothetical protein